MENSAAKLNQSQLDTSLYTQPNGPNVGMEKSRNHGGGHASQMSLYTQDDMVNTQHTEILNANHS
jgi:hypothetical protein